MSAHIDMLERIADTAQLWRDTTAIGAAAETDPAVQAITAAALAIYDEDLTNLREHIRSCRQIDAEEPISIFVWGQIWDHSAGNCFLAVTAPPTLSFTREAVSDWLRENARDFRNVVDFRAVKGEAEIGWADEAAGIECEEVISQQLGLGDPE